MIFNVLLFAAAFAACMLSVKDVGLFNDDWFYKQAAICDAGVIVQFMKWHIAFFNGRTIVHLLAMLFLRFKQGLLVWKTVLSLTVALTCLVISKIAGERTGTKPTMLLSVFFFFSVIPYMFTDSVYWLTGSFNYFFPTALTLVLYFLVIREKSLAATAVISFLCGASTEQTGLMCVGMLFLILLDYIIKNKKINLYHSVNFILSFIGFLTVILSPGTFHRADTQKSMGVSAAALNFLSILKTNWFSNVYVIVLMVSLSVVTSLLLFRFGKRNAFTKVFGKINGILLIIFSALQSICEVFPSLVMRFPFDYGKELFSRISLIVFALFTLLFVSAIITVSVNVYIYKKEPLPFICVCLAVGSQLIMTAAQSIILRAAVPAVFWFILADVYFILLLWGEKLTHSRKIKSVFLLLTLLTAAAHVFVSCMNTVPSYEREIQKLDSVQMEEFTSQTEEIYYGYYQGDGWNKEKDFTDFTHIYKF